MSLIDYIVLAALGAAAQRAVIFIAERKSKGKSGCGCCPHREGCSGRPCE